MTSLDEENIPRELRNFVYRYLDSVELVRVLLLLHADPGKQWSIDQLTSELRSSPLSIERRLADLYDRKILRRISDVEKHSYTPYDGEMSRLIDQLSRFEKRFPYRLIDMIYSRREGALREFANAFTFKKEK